MYMPIAASAPWQPPAETSLRADRLTSPAAPRDIAEMSSLTLSDTNPSAAA